MRPFTYESPSSVLEATNPGHPEFAFIAGGTTIVDLMKLEVMKPSQVVDLNALPMRGIEIPPQLFPAQGCETRIQHELFSFFLPSRSQWNWTFTRPYLSVWISSPEGPTTTAVWQPCTKGCGVTRGGRNGVEKGIHSKVFW